MPKLRIPTAQLRLHGTFRQDRRPLQEPEPEPGWPERPDWLPENARKCWDLVLPQLDKMGCLARIDGNTLVRYCQMWGRWVEAERFIQQYGSTYALKANDGTIKYFAQHPQVAIAHRLSLALTKIESEFGMTPVGRTRIEVAGKSPKGITARKRNV